MQGFNWFGKCTCDREWSTFHSQSVFSHPGTRSTSMQVYMLCRCCSSQGVEAVTQIVRAARGACDDPAMTYRPRACEGGALAASFSPPPRQDRTNRSHQTPPPPTHPPLTAINKPLCCTANRSVVRNRTFHNNADRRGSSRIPVTKQTALTEINM